VHPAEHDGKREESQVDRVELLVLQAVEIGIVGTAIMDSWTTVRSRLLGTPALSYALVGRWLAYLMRGKFRHDRIAAVPAIPGELAIGWTAHYITGIAFAAVLLAIWGTRWVQHPTLGPALIVGTGSVLAPFLIMQPGMGLGIAASRTPRPVANRVNSLVTHIVFALGLYAGGWVTRLYPT
jgi:Protein of unknown function (DUF2938)